MPDASKIESHIAQAVLSMRRAEKELLVVDLLPRMWTPEERSRDSDTLASARLHVDNADYQLRCALAEWQGKEQP